MTRSPGSGVVARRTERDDPLEDDGRRLGIGRVQHDRETIAIGANVGDHAGRHERTVRHLGNVVAERGIAGEMAVDHALQASDAHSVDRTKHDRGALSLVDVDPDDVVAMRKWALVALRVGDAGASSRLGLLQRLRVRAMLGGRTTMMLGVAAVHAAGER